MLVLGKGPTPFVTTPGSGPSWGGESVGGASRNLGLVRVEIDYDSSELWANLEQLKYVDLIRVVLKISFISCL